MAEYRVIEDDLADAAVIALLALHLAEMHALSPACKVHAMPVERLRQPDVTFYSAWDGDCLAAVGALREIEPGRGELKSMRVAPAHLRRGVGGMMLAHLVSEGRAAGYRRLSLETGSNEPFAAARAMYARAGFVPCSPFAGYTDTTFSRYYTLDL